MQAYSIDTGEIMDNAQIVSNGPVKEPSNKDEARENKDFVMLYRHFIKQISDLGVENPTALRILLFLIKHMDGFNAIGAPQKLIASMLGLSRQTVSTHIAYLQDHGWIEIYKLGKANVYIINPEVVWTSYAGQKAYCKFQGTFLLDSDDQWAIPTRERTQVKYLDPLMLAKMAGVEFPEE